MVKQKTASPPITTRLINASNISTFTQIAGESRPPRIPLYIMNSETHPLKGGNPQIASDAIKNNTKSSTDFSYASRLVETMMLGNIAVLMANKNVTLEYNPEKMEFTNLPEANELLHYKYREGWTL